MEEPYLFRSEVLEKQRNKNYGVVSINMPFPYIVSVFGFSLITVLVLFFLIKGEFSEKFIVTGYLESTKGIVRVYPSKNGVIIKKFVEQGAEVKKGDKLFLIDLSFEDHNHDVLLQLKRRKALITTEIISKKRHLQDLKQLVDKKYIPSVTYTNKQDELLELRRQKSSIDIDILNYKHQQSFIVYSPLDGIVSNLLYQEGQFSNVAKPLVKIVPKGAELRAELFIPAKQAGFLSPESNVIIRYDAYPYMRFGTTKATIDQISQSVLTDAEDEKPFRIGEPYYKVTALLDKQFVTIYGKQKSIRHGMTLSAVIVGTKRKMWQWILDPVFSFYGDVFS
jgi:membrane fusion protein